MMEILKIEPLADHPEFISSLQCLFETEWLSHYGPSGPGNAQIDLIEYSNRKGLPLGVVAILDGKLCGAAVLKKNQFRHTHIFFLGQPQELLHQLFADKA